VHVADRDDFSRWRKARRAPTSLVSGASQRREAPLQPAVVEEVVEFSAHNRFLFSSGATAFEIMTSLRLIGLLRTVVTGSSEHR
jgi:hypothetical protein